MSEGGMMAKFTCEIDKELINKLEKLEDTDTIIPRILEQAMPIVTARTKAVLSKFKDSGKMVSSLKQTVAERNQYGWWICVRPTGTTKVKGSNKRVRNMAKLAFLIYGHTIVSKKGKRFRFIAPKTNIGVIINSTESQVVEVIQRALEQEAGL